MLSNRPYPMYVGVLAVAHEEGLRELTAEIIQAPSKENEYRCIARATAVLVKNNERYIFTDVGDASPKNCSAKVSTALERMASTRAQGRALRAAINLGYTLLEELPEDEARELRDKHKAGNGSSDSDSRPAATASQQPTPPPARAVAAPPQEETTEEPAPTPPPPAANGAATNETIAAKICDVCKRPLTTGQRDISVKAYGKPLCPAHQKEAAKTG
jgi:hypothetical protein